MTRTAASGSSPFTWKYRRLHHLGDVGRVHARTADLGCSREPELVVDHHVHGAADLVPGYLRQVEGRPRPRPDPRTQRRRGAAPGARAERAPSAAASPIARAMPSTTGPTVSRWLGLAASVSRISLPVGVMCLPTAPRWYFTSPEPCVLAGSSSPSNFAEDLRVRLADHVGQHVEPAAVRHPEHDVAHPCVARVCRRGRRAWARGSPRPRGRTASGRGTWCAGSARTPPPR